MGIRNRQTPRNGRWKALLRLICPGALRFFAAVSLIAGAIGLTTDFASAQPLPELPPSESKPDDIEVLNRGPLHESFAELHSEAVEPGLIVPKHPPEPVDEIPPDYRPEGDDIAWIPGYWAWDDDREDFIWVSGTWRKTPPNRRWVPGTWAEADGKWQWSSGFWASASRGKVDYLPVPPQSVEAGPSSEQVGGQFYIPGCWQFGDDAYRWRAGYWSPRYDNWVWVPDRYIWTPRGCIFRSGYWDYPPAGRGLLYAPVHFHPSWYGAQRRYSPHHVIDVGASFFANLFLRPQYGHYYVGNYYGAQYRHHHMHPWVHTGRHSGIHTGVRTGRYDPLYAFYQYSEGARHSFLTGVRGWHNYFDGHREHRPAHTLALQNQRQLAGNLRGMTSLASDPRRRLNGVRTMRPISESSRERIRQQTEPLRAIRRQRAQLESSLADRERARQQRGTGVRSLQLPNSAGREREERPRVTAGGPRVGGGRPEQIARPRVTPSARERLDSLDLRRALNRPSGLERSRDSLDLPGARATARPRNRPSPDRVRSSVDNTRDTNPPAAAPSPQRRNVPSVAAGRDRSPDRIAPRANPRPRAQPRSSASPRPAPAIVRQQNPAASRLTQNARTRTQPQSRSVLPHRVPDVARPRNPAAAAARMRTQPQSRSVLPRTVPGVARPRNPAASSAARSARARAQAQSRAAMARTAPNVTRHRNPAASSAALNARARVQSQRRAAPGNPSRSFSRPSPAMQPSRARAAAGGR